MSKFIFYLRTAEGHIERLGNMIAIGPESILDSYQYEEPLMDFPEPIVFWASEEGSSMGMAPLISSPED
jgi:hypothetical protein